MDHTTPSSSTSTSPSTPAAEAGDENSKNWKAIAIPSIDGSTTQLNVTGDVRTGFVPLKLTKRDNKENIPGNVVPLNLTGMGGGPFEQVTYQEDITGKALNFVLVYIPNYEIEAAIKIVKVMS